MVLDGGTTRNKHVEPDDSKAASLRLLVLVLRNKEIRSWPKFPLGGTADYMVLSVALEREFATDAHMAAYSAPSIARRLARDALRQPEACAKLPGGIAMVLASFDVDCPAAHVGDPRAADSWWVDETEKVTVLLRRHPRGFVYRTRGGYRIIYALPAPIILVDDPDAEAWSFRYCGWIAYLERAFEIVADPACKDWTRLYRLPHATRDEGGRPERREQIGDANAIGEWVCEPSAEDNSAARKLNKKRATKDRKDNIDPPRVLAGDGLLAQAFRGRGWLGDQIEPGKWLAMCPNAGAHTKGESYNSSTVLYAPAPGEEVGWLHCSHAHCQGRTVRDALAAFSDAELAAAREAAGLGSPRANSAASGTAAGDQTEASASRSLPQIECGPDLHQSTNAAERALAALEEPRVYAKARGLAIVAREGGRKLRGVNREPGAPFIHALPPAGLREHLSRAAEWLTWNESKGDWKRVLPPGPVVAALAARGGWPLLPSLVGIVEVPTMREDGSVLDVPGYDEASGLLYDPCGVAFPKVPEEPTAEDVKRAIAELREPFLDFEWEEPAVDIPVVLALVLTFPARPTFQGTAPCFCLDSTTRGSGKGLACDVAVMAGTGRRPAVSILSAESEEQRKALFALSLEGHRAFLIDNVARPLGGAVLSAALTSGEVRDRVLGVSRMASAPFMAVVVATGNNIRFFGDFDRRVLVARQVPTVEYPEDREPLGGFRHPDLRAWVAAEYPRLVVAALTILRAFWVAGRPPHGLKTFGSFEVWDAIVRAACIWAGIGDPLACRERIRAQADDDHERIGALLTSWQDAFQSSPATVAEAVEKGSSHDALRQALAEFDSKGDPERPNVTSIGRRIRTVVGRIVDQKRLERVGSRSPVVYRVGLVGLEGSDPSDGDTRACAPARAYPGGPEQTPPTPPTPQQRSEGQGPAGCECMGDAADA